MNIDDLQVITVTGGEPLVCPECGSKEFLVHDKIQRTRKLIRVDRAGDLEVAKADIANTVQSILLQCSSCLLEYAPDSNLNSKENPQREYTEAYETDTRALYDFPSSITNMAAWRS